MRKLLMVMITVLISVTAFGQKKNAPEAKAEKKTKEMQAVLEFDDATYQKVYTIQLDQFKQQKELKAKTGDDEEAFKIARREITATTNKDLVEVIGEENMKKWKQHVKANKKKQ